MIDCEGSSGSPHRGFWFHSGETSDAKVEGFTIRNGYTGWESSNDQGGGIFCENASPSITNCHLIDNTADIGGGIRCVYSSAMITDCLISGNLALYGGGIACYAATLCVSDCVITENSTKDSLGEGGGIYFVSCDSTEVVNCIISENTARYGGGIELNRSSASITECSIVNNAASRAGGGIYCYQDASRITLCTISGNSGCGASFVESSGSITCSAIIDNLSGGISVSDSTATIGGAEGQGNYFGGNISLYGMDLYGSSDQTSLINATYNTFAGFHLSDYYVTSVEAFDLSHCISELTPIAQDIYLSPSGSDENDGLTPGTAFLTMRHALILVYATESNPITVHLAPGVYSLSTTGESFPLPLLEHVFIVGQDSALSVLDAEGETYMFCGYDDEDIRISRLSFINGGCSSNSCIDMWESSVSITYCSFSDNSGAHGGSAINSYYSAPEIMDCSFTNNSSIQDGGAVYCSDSTPVISACTFSGNVSKNGGGIYLRDSNASICDCTFIGNQVSQMGGAFYSSGHCITEMRDCTMTGNAAANSRGTVYCRENTPSTGSMAMINCLVSDNTGGGVFCSGDCVHVIDNCLISKNDGYGISCEDAILEISNCSIQDNHGPGVKGDSDAVHNLTSCIISGNTSNLGGGIYCSGEPLIVNCLITENTSESDGGGVYCYGNPTFISSAITDNHSGESGGGIAVSTFGLSMYSGPFPVILRVCGVAVFTATGYPLPLF